MHTIAQFRNRLDSLMEGIQIIDYNWRYVYLNHVMAAQSKMPIEALLGYTMMEKYPGIEDSEMFGLLRECMADRKSFRIENKFTYPDLSESWFDLTIEPADAGICILSVDITETKNATALQLKTEEKFRHALDHMIEGVQIHGFDWRYLYVNDALVNYSTYSREELLGFTVMEKYPGIEQTDLFKSMQRCLDERIPDKLETEFTFPNGTKAFFELSIQPVPEGIFILSVDRSEQQKAKEKVEKVNRLYAFISAINQSIVHISDQKALLTNACNVATEIGGFKMAWIGMFDYDVKTINLIEQSGVSENDVQLFTNAPYPENGPQDYVLRSGTYYNCDDITNDPELESWRPFAARHGIQSGIVLPIRKGGNIIGTFNLYSTKINFADEQEIALLEEVTGDISFALDIFEKTEKHSQTEALVIANEKRFRALIEKSPDVKTMSNEKGELIYGSPAVTKTLGYMPKEFLGTSIIDYIHPDAELDFMAKRKSILDHPGKSFHFQLQLQHKNTSWIWCEGTVTNMMHESGVHAFVANFIDVSEKKMAQRQQEFDRNNLNALINNTDDLMWSVDMKMKLITSNERFDEMVEKIQGDKIEKGSEILKGASAEQTERFKSYYQRAFSGETFKEIEYTRFPVEYYSEISFHPIRKGNEIIGTACHSRDITGLKKLEQELEKTIWEISDYKYALDQSSIVAITDQKGIITYVNDNFCRISKYSSGELIGQDHRIVNSGFHPKDFIKKLWKTIAGGNVWRGELKNKAKDGSVYWVDTTIVPFLDELGKPYQYVAIRSDITQKKSIEEQLRKSEAFSREVLNSLSAHIAVIDSIGDIAAVNEAWRRFSRENGRILINDMELNNYFDVCEKSSESGDEIASEVLFGLKAVMDKKKSDFYLEYPCHSDDIQRWFAMVARPFEGDEQLVVVAHQDISERKSAQENLIRNNIELTKTNFELDRFAYSVSHDLRAPLTSILGLVSFIEEETNEPETRHHIEMIKTRIHRLDEFIRNILSYSRNNRTGLEVSKISVSDAAQEIIKSLCSIKDAEGIQFETDIRENAPFYSDRRSLCAVMENIISNAIKFHNNEKPGNTISITGTSDADQLQLRISDNGIGIAPEHHEKIFDMFFRLSGKVDGSGIGLYIAREIVEKMQGTITVESEEGKGTTFIITFKNLNHDTGTAS